MALAETLFVVTAYAYGCGATGLTYNERFPHPGRTVAADLAVLPLLAEIAIPGVGVRVVEDTGRLVRGNRIDVFVESCAKARRFGRRSLYVLRVR